MDMRYTDLSCVEFAERLSSKDAVPGGGGASALAAALAAASRPPADASSKA